MRRKLQEARKKANLTQAQVAKYLKITVQAYQRIEYGTRIGTVEAWDKLEDLFGVNQRQLRESS